MTEQKITPCLWFDFNAEEAVAHYLSIFPNSRITSTTRYGEFAAGRKGAVMTIFFEIDGQRLLALNGGPQFKFTPAVSLFVNCYDQAEVDRGWDRFSEGGAPGQRGWLADEFGVSFQIAPSSSRAMQSSDAAAWDRLLGALRPMTKLDIATLQHAAEAK